MGVTHRWYTIPFQGRNTSTRIPDKTYHNASTLGLVNKGHFSFVFYPGGVLYISQGQRPWLQTKFVLAL